ncbi:hypothetical protein CTAYLR_007758 [Chrysophaeum taylorii]|uniref:Enoyl reductase (ER) domain-containing protein n=1 Tax=Chrysophaeum taylorii TaxID=2483200 RepID=A0AAD7UL59_9STRA|nr:hypothetical protein CTAYLR_007758 [Chrysophaeum taylorii]
MFARGALRRASRRLSTTTTTRAAVCESLETGTVSIRDDWPVREVGSNDVLVETKAAGINFGELLQLRGLYQERLEPPFVPGNEMSGIVRAVGERVSSVSVGDAVVGLPRGGAWARDVTLPEAAVIPLHGPRTGDAEIDFASAASLSIAYGTAYMALKHRARLDVGETVLVTAAAGGVGSASIEVARYLGAGRIIAAAGDQKKVDLALRLGADEGFVYTEASLENPKAFRELTLKKFGGFDVAVDMVGGPLLEPIVRSLNFDGRCVVVGFASGQIPKIPSNLLLVKNVSVVGLYWGAHAVHKPALFRESCKDVVELWRARHFNPHVGASFALDDANDAIADVMARKTTGKVVLLPSS